MEWVGENIHSSLFSENLKFSFPPKLGGMGGNEIRFNNFFTKTPKIPLVGPKSPKIPIHICIRPKAQTKDENMSEDKHVVS